MYNGQPYNEIKFVEEKKETIKTLVSKAKLRRLLTTRKDEQFN